MINKIWKPFPSLEKKLIKTQDLVLSKAQIRNQEISDMITDLANSGGKMTRPAFFYLFNDFGNKPYVEEDVTAAAASIEILHIATLIHDDVIDDSPLRRSVATIHSKYGMRNAIYAGDYLFTVYFDLIARVSPTTKDILMNSTSMRRILLGELDQMLINDNPNATVKMYLKEISGKTAELFQLSAMFGAVMGGASEKIITRAKYIGHDIGMAFQIIDDLLDYKNNKETGKPELEDISNRVFSLPIIMALKQNNPELKELLEVGDIKKNKDKIADIIVQSGALDEAKRFADHYTNRAINRIILLPNSESKKILLKLTKKMLKREN